MVKFEFNIRLISPSRFNNNSLSKNEQYIEMMTDISITNIKLNIFNRELIIEPKVNIKKGTISFIFNLNGDFKFNKNGYIPIFFEENNNETTNECFEKNERLIVLYDFDDDLLDKLVYTFSEYIIALIISYPKMPFCGMPLIIKINNKNFFYKILFKNVFDWDLSNKNNDIEKILSNEIKSININTTLQWLSVNINSKLYKDSLSKLYNALTHLISKYDYEAFLYAILGLESFYLNNDKNISYNLAENICSVFSFIQKDKLRNIYKTRSKIIHGEYAIYNFFSTNLERDIDELDNQINFLYLIIILTFQKLIITNTNKILFNKQIIPKFINNKNQ